MGTYQTYLTVFHFKAATLPQPTTWWTTRWWRPRMLMRYVPQLWNRALYSHSPRLCSTRSQSQRQVLGRSCMKYISTQHIKRPVCGSVYTTSPLMSKLSTSILSFDVSYQTSTKMDSAVLGKLVASRPTYVFFSLCILQHHPVTGLPSFFIHPCLLGEAMSTFDCSKEDYLMVWLGLVGGCVGLWVPSEMAIESQ